MSMPSDDLGRTPKGLDPIPGRGDAARRIPPMPDHDLALNLVRTTEAASLGAARWVGRGDKIAADQGAVDAMRLFFNAVPMDGVVVIGEGEKDEAPMFYNGERIGTGSRPEVDVAVDPIDGTRLVAQGQANALSVVAVSERGSMFDPGSVRLHGEDRHRPRGRDGDRHHGPDRDEHQERRQGQADVGQRRDR